MTPAIILDARAIVAGSYRPWQFQSDIASPADWCFAAQCALDGDQSDLSIYLAELERARSVYTLPDCELWKHDLAVEHVAERCVRAEAA